MRNHINDSLESLTFLLDETILLLNDSILTEGLLDDVYKNIDMKDTQNIIDALKSSIEPVLEAIDEAKKDSPVPLREFLFSGRLREILGVLENLNKEEEQTKIKIALLFLAEVKDALQLLNIFMVGLGRYYQNSDFYKNRDFETSGPGNMKVGEANLVYMIKLDDAAKQKIMADENAKTILTKLVENYNKMYQDITTAIGNVINNGALSKLAKYEKSSFFGFIKSNVKNDDAIELLNDLEEECKKLLGPIDNLKKKFNADKMGFAFLLSPITVENMALKLRGSAESVDNATAKAEDLHDDMQAAETEMKEKEGESFADLKSEVGESFVDKFYNFAKGIGLDDEKIKKAFVVLADKKDQIKSYLGLKKESFTRMNLSLLFEVDEKSESFIKFINQMLTDLDAEYKEDDVKKFVSSLDSGVEDTQSKPAIKLTRGQHKEFIKNFMQPPVGSDKKHIFQYLQSVKSKPPTDKKVAATLGKHMNKAIKATGKDKFAIFPEE